MKKIPFFKAVSVTASIVLLGPLSGVARADGTETLGPPSIAIQSGTGIVVAGTGLLSQPGTVNINVPGTVKQVLLYWEGQSIVPNPGDATILINGNLVSGTLIGGPTLFFGNRRSSTFRADITSLNLVTPGLNALTVEGLNFGGANNGAGVMVIFDDGSGSANIQLRDGNDLAFIGFSPPLNTTAPQTFVFAPAGSDRTATLSMFFSSVAGSASGGGFRPTAIEVSVGGSTTVLNNQLNSNDGDEWDTLTVPVLIPAGATMLTVQALSADNLSTGNLPASFAWNAAGLSVPEIPTVGGQGCTPGFWKQRQHFDRWTPPYTPSTLFSAVFENAFPGMTLLQVLKQRGGGLKALGRHAVAALLNAASPDVNYDLTVNQVIAEFNAVFPGTKDEFEDLKDRFEGFNVQGCPLD